MMYLQRIIPTPINIIKAITCGLIGIVDSLPLVITKMQWT